MNNKLKHIKTDLVSITLIKLHFTHRALYNTTTANVV